MAKKKTRKVEPQTNAILSRLQGNMKQLQRDAEALLTRTRKRAAQLVSRDQKRALERLLSQAKHLGADLEKRAKQASKEVESRSEQLLATVEKEATKRLTPLLKRLDLPSRQEVQSLSRRLAQLEKRVPASRPAATQAAPPPTVDDTPAASGA